MSEPISRGDLLELPDMEAKRSYEAVMDMLKEEKEKEYQRHRAELPYRIGYAAIVVILLFFLVRGIITSSEKYEG